MAWGRSMRKLTYSSRGAILIHVALSLFVLSAMSAFVLDYGVLWVSRRQAQNAADGGALAGAAARAFDETANPPAGNGPAFQSAWKAAQANRVFGAGATSVVSWTCPSFAGGGTDCVQVEVFRDGTNGSTRLPTWFAPLLGINSQGIKATATARVRQGNTTNCIRPLAVADEWAENGTANPLQFERWVSGGGGAQLSPYDVYTAPSANSPGTGYRLPGDFGRPLVLKGGNNPYSGTSPMITHGWSLPVQLPDGVGGYLSGPLAFQDAIEHCVGNMVAIGQYLPTEGSAMVLQTQNGVNNLRLADPSASWTGSTVSATCAPGCAPISPRIVPIPVFDMDEWQGLY